VPGRQRNKTTAIHLAGIVDAHVFQLLGDVQGHPETQHLGADGRGTLTHAVQLLHDSQLGARGTVAERGLCDGCRESGLVNEKNAGIRHRQQKLVWMLFLEPVVVSPPFGRIALHFVTARQQVKTFRIHRYPSYTALLRDLFGLGWIQIWFGPTGRTKYLLINAQSYPSRSTVF